MTKCYLKRQIRHMEVEKVNARQAAKAAAKHIEELEDMNKRYAHDIRLFYQTISHMIQHGSPCDYCEDREECRTAGKDLEIGCEEWFLDSGLPETEETPDES